MFALSFCENVSAYCNYSTHYVVFTFWDIA